MDTSLIRLLFLFVGAGVSLLVGVQARWLGLRLGLLDFPDGKGGRKLHRHITPLVGGIAITGAGVIGAALLATLAGPGVNQHMLLWFIICATGMFGLGAFDDRAGLSPHFRLLADTVIMLAAISQVDDFRVQFLLFSGQVAPIIFPGPAGAAFTVVCLVGLLNAVNMADGKNGMVIGQAIVWSVILYIRLPVDMAPLMLCLLGALVVLMWFNMRGRLFLGDGGSYGLSAIFGLLAIYCWNRGYAFMHADDIALIFAVPVFDTIRLMMWRVLQGKSPFTPGRDHLHHHLYVRWGWPAPLPWVLMLVAVPNMAAIIFPGTALLWLGATLAAYVLLLLVATGQARRIA